MAEGQDKRGISLKGSASDFMPSIIHWSSLLSGCEPGHLRLHSIQSEFPKPRHHSVGIEWVFNAQDFFWIWNPWHRVGTRGIATGLCLFGWCLKFFQAQRSRPLGVAKKWFTTIWVRYFLILKVFTFASRSITELKMYFSQKHWMESPCSCPTTSSSYLNTTYVFSYC